MNQSGHPRQAPQMPARLVPADGRRAFDLAHRQAEAGDTAAAARAYAELLICGAHGKPWHRHEVAAKLAALGPAAKFALAAKPACEVVDANDLATYVGARGPVATPQLACASGTHAVALAASWIRAGRADVVLAGGTDLLCRFVVAGFNCLRATSESTM
jgi:hypothetical protein